MKICLQSIFQEYSEFCAGGRLQSIRMVWQKFDVDTVIEWGMVGRYAWTYKRKRASNIIGTRKREGTRKTRGNVDKTEVKTIRWMYGALNPPFCWQVVSPSLFTAAQERLETTVFEWLFEQVRWVPTNYSLSGITGL